MMKGIESCQLERIKNGVFLMEYVVGIDLGTSSLKGIVTNKAGKVIACASEHYSFFQKQTGWSEQNPDDWFIALQKVLRKFIAEVANFSENLKGISFSGQMHSLVLLDEKKQVLRPAILWNDVRTSRECEQIKDKLGEQLLEITKNQVLEGFTLPKLLWVKKNEPEIWSRVRHILLPKDYLRYRLTGKMHIDFSDAAGTLLLDLERQVWSEEVAKSFDIPFTYFPPLVESLKCVGTLLPESLGDVKISPKVKVMAGAADNACAALSAGIFSSEKGLVSIGTSGVFLTCGEGQEPVTGELHWFNHAVPASCYLMGVTLAAGYSLQWMKQTFAQEKSFPEALSGIEKVLPGANGLLFTPYIVGERVPYPDGQIRGSFLGIDTKHTFPHFMRAVIEGVTFSLKDVQVLLEKMLRKTFTEIISVGGGAKNKEWAQIQADVFDAEIFALAVEEGPSMGAAMIAAVGVGWFDSLEICAKSFVSYHKVATPITENVRTYQKIYSIYQQVYGQTKVISHELRAFDDENVEEE